MLDQPKQLVFGPVIVEWDAAWLFPIAVDLSRKGWFVTLCEIRYRYGKGDYFLPITARYGFDGTSTPWLIRIVPGFARLDWHLLAALPHDFIIDHPDLLPRSVADGIFVSILLALAENRTDAPKWIVRIQGYLMFFAVWTWTIVTRILHPPNNLDAKPPEQVVQPPASAPSASPATATLIVEEETKEETSTPPPAVVVVNTGNGFESVESEPKK